MNYDIPALDAKAKAEKKLIDELAALCSKMNRLEAQTNKALRIMETAQKTFAHRDADQKTFGDVEPLVMDGNSIPLQ